MKIGKLSNEQLTNLVLNKLPSLSSSTLVGAGIGADCAWQKIGDKLLVSSTDPITAGKMQSGKLAIHVSCNDIAACGIRPSGLLIVVIAPPSASEEDVSTIVTQASDEAAKLGVDIVGGHTEVSASVNEFIVISTAFGIVDHDHPVPKGKEKPGDKLIMTKSACIEGSYIASKEHYEKLVGKVSKELIDEASKYEDSISVVKEGEICGSLASLEESINQYGFRDSAVSLMHDITEGGVYGAAYEMASFSNVGLRLDKGSIPITEASRQICIAMNLDPYRLISSGSLLIASSEEKRVINALDEAGIKATVIGEFIEEGYYLIDTDGDTYVLESPKTDELYNM